MVKLDIKRRIGDGLSNSVRCKCHTCKGTGYVGEQMCGVCQGIGRHAWLNNPEAVPEQERHTIYKSKVSRPALEFQPSNKRKMTEKQSEAYHRTLTKILYEDREPVMVPMSVRDPGYMRPMAPASTISDDDNDSLGMPLDKNHKGQYACFRCGKVTIHLSKTWYTKTHPGSQFSNRTRHQEMECTSCDNIVTTDRQFAGLSELDPDGKKKWKKNRLRRI